MTSAAVTRRPGARKIETRHRRVATDKTKKAGNAEYSGHVKKVSTKTRAGQAVEPRARVARSVQRNQRTSFHRDNHRPALQITVPGNVHPHRLPPLFDSRSPGQVAIAPGSGHPSRSQLRRKSNTVPGQVLRRKSHEIAAAPSQPQAIALRKEAHRKPAANAAGQAVVVASKLAAVGPGGRET